MVGMFWLWYGYEEILRELVIEWQSDILKSVNNSKLMCLLNAVQISEFNQEISETELVVVDGNIPAESMKYLCELSRAHNVPGRYQNWLV